MNLKINRNVLAEALSSVIPFVSAKTPINILKNAKCTTKGSRMKIEANDTQGGIVRYVELLDCDTDGAFLVNAADLNNLVTKITDAEICIESKGESLSLSYGKSSAEFSMNDAADYPSFAFMDDDAVSMDIPANILLSCIETGKNFVASDVLRPTMTAIYCFANSGRFGFCASDTRCLAVNSWNMEGCNSDGAFYIMPNVFGPLSSLCRKNDRVTVTFNSKRVIYRAGNTIIQSIQCNGKYPDFNRVIPKSHSIECKVLKQDLLKPLSRLLMFCEVSKCVRFTFNPFDVTMTAENFDDGKRSVEHIDVGECTGELVIGLNADNIIKCIKVFKSSDIVIEMTDQSRPVVVKSEGDPDMIVLSMPMQIVQ